MGTTRRQFLARSGALAGAAMVGGGVLALPGGAASTAGLTPTRRATYAALAERVVTGPAMRLEPAAAGLAVEAFARVYDGWPDDERRRADRVLDDLAAAPAGLRAGVGRAPRLRSPTPRASERRDLVLLQASAGLVAVVTGQPDGGHDAEVI